MGGVAGPETAGGGRRGRASQRGCPPHSDVPGGGGATGWLRALPASSGCWVHQSSGDAAAAVAVVVHTVVGPPAQSP